MFPRKIKKDILNGRILEQTLIFLFPVFLSYLLQQIYSFADNIILGQIVGKQALASVGGSASSVVNIINNCIAGLTAATMVRCAQNYGRGDVEGVSKAVQTGFGVAIIGGIVLAIGTGVLVDPFLQIMHEPAENMAMSRTYLYIYLLALMPYFVYQTGVSIFRAIGDSRRPIWFILIMAFNKILFDLLLAGIFHLGVLGTSLATLLAHTISALIILIVYSQTPDIYQYSLKNFHCPLSEVRKLLKIGVPFAIQNMMFSIPNALIQAKINEFGTDAIAAYAAFGSVDSLFWCFSSSLGTSTITMAGQNYGRGNLRRVRKIAWIASGLEAFGAVCFGSMFYVFAPELLALFLKDPEALELGIRMLRVISLSYLTYVFVETFAATFKACGLIRIPLIISIITICGTRVAYILMFPQINAVRPVFALPLSWIVTSIAYFLYFYLNKALRTVNK